MTKAAFPTALLFLGAATAGSGGAARAASYDYTGAVQVFSAPTTGTYDITAYGAEGGSYTYPFGQIASAGGGGAEVSGDVTLGAGAELFILVGGSGGSVNNPPPLRAAAAAGAAARSSFSIAVYWSSRAGAGAAAAAVPCPMKATA